VWAILGTEHPKLGIVGVSLLASGLGCGLTPLTDGPGFAFWITATTTEALVLVVSLYVIRRCGFRVTRQRKGEPVSGGKETSAGSE
jgi:hypothetical protein